MEISNQNQKSGDTSTNLQAGRDITVNSSVIALYSIEEVSKQLLNSVFGELSEETKMQISQNQKSYFQALSESLQKIDKDNFEVKKIIDSPDFQYISKKASISASRSSSVNLHKNLSSLIVQRMNSDNEDLKRIVYNEAINAIEKLTIDQLKILTLCFLLKRTKSGELTNLEQFKQYLEQRIKPFIDFKQTRAEFEHLVYTGCASIDIAIAIIWEDIVGLFKENYPNIFKENSGNSEELLAGNDTVKKLFSIWEGTLISYMNLTSVGIVIASAFYEQHTNDKINIDIWIN